MESDLRQHIGEIYDGGCWDWTPQNFMPNGTVWNIAKFERDVEYCGKTWRCVILQRVFYDPLDLTAVDYAEDILAESWQI